MVIEMLAGLLVNAGYCDTKGDGEWGSIVIAIEPGMLIDIKQFKTDCPDLINIIKVI
jgi:LDH2 family malate/lactate/ureidoglycolate dehydrogenase